MACPNQSSTVTLPYPSGTALVTPIDQNTCIPLDATKITGIITSGAIPLNATSVPSMVNDSSGIHLGANGAALGASWGLTFTYTPNGSKFVMTATVGQPIVAVGSTLTP